MNVEQKDKSYRKPYCQPIEKNWWYQLRYYLFYIVRESTAFFMIWFSIVLMYGVICTRSNEMGQDEFYRFIFFLQKPLVVILNLLTFLTALLHSVTWFNLAPKAANMVIAGKKVAAPIFILFFWLVAILCSIFLMLLVLGCLG